MYEYKQVTFYTTELATGLNQYSKEGWAYVETISESGPMRTALLEREVVEEETDEEAEIEYLQTLIKLKESIIRRLEDRILFLGKELNRAQQGKGE